MPKTYIKKPITVQAIQWTGHNAEDVIKFINRPSEMDIKVQCEVIKHYGLTINVNGESVKLKTGDYLVKNDFGNIIPYINCAFESLYEEKK